MIEEIINKHAKISLLFSGGKDSMACLFLLKKYWNKINVMWVNTGAAFPETIEMMEYFKSILPIFTEIKSDQPNYINYFGLPSDVVPINKTLTGSFLLPNNETKINIYIDCCAANIWFPSYNAAKDYGATMIIKGTKSSDKQKSPIKSMDIVDGITHFMPIENWSNHDVLAYLKTQDFEIPDFYSLHDSSLDCWDCTAYCKNHIDKLNYMKNKHPEKHDKLIQKLCIVYKSIQEELNPMRQMLGLAYA